MGKRGKSGAWAIVEVAIVQAEARWHVAHRARMEAPPPTDNMTRGADEYPNRLLSAITAVQV